MWNHEYGYRRRERGMRDVGSHPRGRYDYQMGSGRSSRPYGRDYWWLGEREMERQGLRGRYDENFRRFSEENRPRFSPVGGMYPPMGGRFAAGNAPRPLREHGHFSDWTRWF